MPRFRDYTEATSLEPTDAFVLDRETVGTMYIEAQDVLGRCITYVVDGGGAVIATGVVGDLWVPFGVTILGATLLADQTGSVVVDIWSDAYGAYPPTDADSITGASPPTITAGVKAQDTTLSGWTTALPGGNTLRFNIDSVSAITRLTIALRVL